MNSITQYVVAEAGKSGTPIPREFIENVMKILEENQFVENSEERIISQLKFLISDQALREAAAR